MCVDGESSRSVCAKEKGALGWKRLHSRPVKDTPEHPHCGAASVTGFEWDAFASKQGGTAKPSPLQSGTEAFFIFRIIRHFD